MREKAHSDQRCRRADQEPQCPQNDALPLKRGVASVISRLFHRAKLHEPEPPLAGNRLEFERSRGGKLFLQGVAHTTRWICRNVE